MRGVGAEQGTWKEMLRDLVRTYNVALNEVVLLGIICLCCVDIKKRGRNFLSDVRL